MATFEARVEGLTGLSIDGSSAPTQSELTEFLKDGVIDVTERTLILRPQDSANFTARSATQSSNGANFNGTKIVSVIREAGADGDTDGSTAWRECRRIPPQSQSRVTDSTSLEYATKYNPVYTLDDSAKVYVYPTPDASDDGYQVYYINNTPQNSSGTALVYSHSDLKYFPQDKYYLVVLYAACQSLLNKLSSYAISESIPSWTAPAGFVKPTFSAPSLASVGALTLPSVPIVPTISSQSVADFSSLAPSYIAPVLQSQTALEDYWTLTDFGDSDPGALSITSVPPATPSLPSISAPDISSVTISNVGTPPTYTAPKVGGATEELTASIEAATAGEATDKYDFSRWFDLAADYIEDEEDVELATAQLQKIRAYIESYSTQMQSNLNTFNKEDKEYQAKLQEAIQQAQINAQEAQKEGDLTLQASVQDYTLELQKYQADVGKYQADVSKEVQEYTQKLSRYQLELSTVHQAWAKTESDNLAKYQADIQNELNKFNKENVIYQATMQEKIQEAQLLDTHETRKVQKYQAEIQVYGSEVNAKIQEWINEEWTQKFQKYTSDYASKLQTYASDIQNESLRFDKDIQKEAQAHAAAINEVAAEIQLDTSEYNWMSQRYAALKGQYDQAFGLMAPRESEKN